MLLALEGRVQELDDEGEAIMRAFMEEYHELAMRMRERSRLGVSR